jgi:hypothetical protein
MTGFTISNPDPSRLQAIAAKHGLRAIKIGMRANRAYTPKRCREVAEQFTGRKFKPRDYDGMIAAIDAKLNELPDVAVWHYPTQQFITHCPCPGEKRVRIDVHDDLENYAVYAVESDDPNPMNARAIRILSPQPLADWAIHLT